MGTEPGLTKAERMALARRHHPLVRNFLKESGLSEQILDKLAGSAEERLFAALLRSERPRAGKSFNKGILKLEGTLSAVAERLDESLFNLAEECDVLKDIVKKYMVRIGIPRQRGGAHVGYHFACIDAQRRAVEPEKAKVLLAEALQKYRRGKRVEDDIRGNRPGSSAQGCSASDGRMHVGDAHVVNTSVLVEEVLSYLGLLAKDCADLPYYFPQHLRLRNEGSGETAFDNVRQTVRIVGDRRALEEWMAKERERVRREGFDPGRQSYSPSGGMPEEEDGYGHRGFLMETIPWDERAGKRFRQAVVLGDPGFGKSWLLRYEALSLARKAIERLTSDPANIDGIALPVLMRLPDLASRDDMLEDTMVKLLGEGRSDDFRAYLRRQLTSKRGVVLMDAWDEVSSLDERRKLKERIRATTVRLNSLKFPVKPYLSLSYAPK